MLNKLLKICVRKWQRSSQTQGSSLWIGWAFLSVPVLHRVLKDAVVALVKGTGDLAQRGLGRVWESVTLTEVQATLKVKQVWETLLHLTGPLDLRCDLAPQLSVSVNTLRDLQGLEMGGDQIPTPTSSLVCGMVQWKQVLGQFHQKYKHLSAGGQAQKTNTTCS